LNYRERSTISPIKIMSRITRCRSNVRSYCGHYEQSRTTWTEHNLEFLQMLYGGVNGTPLMREESQSINFENVRHVFQLLRTVNPLLSRYDDVSMDFQQEQFALRKISSRNIDLPGHVWTHNYLMPVEDVDPVEGTTTLNDLPLGVDVRDTEIRYGEELAALALIFPYLFTNGRGYYSLCKGTARADEENGGMAEANGLMTIGAYAKRLIHLADRRFGSSVEFLF
ncbi:hypothetical protein EDC96DRAFT_429602, partial [Choanephora cucurbitarum]